MGSTHVSSSASAHTNTRSQILLLLLHGGPLSAADIGNELGFSAAGVRRHLDNLVDEGSAEFFHPRAPHGGVGRSRGRGRPAKLFRLTDAGRAHFGHNYDSLAAAALRSLREVGGSDAIYAFARSRVEDIVGELAHDTAPHRESTLATARALVGKFAEHGYAASLGDTNNGVQLCQHHCPISAVAAEFPELCEAEHDVIAELLGTHIQPLASIAGGHGICTTHIPLTVVHSRAREHCCSDAEGDTVTQSDTNT